MEGDDPHPPPLRIWQVVVISASMQLIISLALHMSVTGTYGLVVVHGLVTACVGTLTTFVLNAWIRGESMDLRKALSVDQIDKAGPAVWDDEAEAVGGTAVGGTAVGGKAVGGKLQESEATRRRRVTAQPGCFRAYEPLYESGGDRRVLGHLAAHDWEQYHLEMEKRMGLGMFDLSDQVGFGPVGFGQAQARARARA